MQTRSSQSMWRASLQTLLLCCCLPVTLLANVPAEQTPDGLSDQEWGSIQQQMVMSRYKAFEQEDGSYASANISNGWHIDYGSDGRTRLTPYKPEDIDYFIGLQLRSLGYANQSAYNKPQQVTSDETRLTYQWDENVKEIWTNSSNRLEQWFEIQQRPQGARQDQQLKLQMVLTTDLQVAQNGNALNFANKISYDKLKVWDSTGAEIPASMHLQNNTLSLVIDDSLAIYPLTIDPSFQQQAYIKASNTEANDRFGQAVAISGDTLVVGANGEDSNGTDQADNSVDSSGAVYVFTRTAGVWSQQAYLKASTVDASDYFGGSVAISGDTLVVGAWGEGSTGAAYVFTRTAGAWSQQAYLKASNPDLGDAFGRTVAISGDTLVVVARAEASNAKGVNGDETNNSAVYSGAAYVFTRAADTWSQQAYLKASNTETRDYFGISISISGDTVVVGAGDEDSNGTESDNTVVQSGAAYVFTRSGAIWSQQAYLKASNLGRSDRFGDSVAISGDTLVVGATGEASNANGVGGDQDDDSLFSSGAAYVFIRTTGTWSQQAYIKASNPDEYDIFGYSIAISGDTLVVGARDEDSNATVVDGNQADNSASDSGAAYVFSREADTWSQQTYIKASNSEPQDYFSTSVAISGETVVVGTGWEDSNATGVNGNQDDNSAMNSGAAYVFDTLAIVKADQTITNFVATPSSGVIGGSSTLSATASSGLPVTFDSSTPTICTVTGNTVTYNNVVGTCTVTADQAGDDNYNPAPQVTLDIGVGLTDQAITNFMATPPTGVVFGSSTLSATGGASGNPVVFGSSTAAVCTVAGSTVSYVTAGTCTVTAGQAGNATYNAAPQVTLNITVAKADQSISGLAANPATGVAGGTSALSATASSGLAVSFGSSTPAICTAAGSTVTYVTAGTCTVTADQAGDAEYNTAPQVTLDITVAKADQTITDLVANPATGVVEGSSACSATASSGLTVSFGSSTAAVCTVSGTTVSYLAAGTCTVTADQAGDAAYNAATQVTVDIVVGKANQTITGLSADPASGVIGGTSTLSIAGAVTAASAVQVAQSGQKRPTTKASGIPVLFGSNTLTICTVSGATVSYLAVGTCTVTADQTGDANYNPAPQVTLDINVIELIPNVPIPTLSLWGLVAMFLMMLGIGGMVVRRKTRS